MNSKKLYLFGLVFVSLAFLSCKTTSTQWICVDGPTFDVLPPSTYNTLQQKYIAMEDFECGTSRVKTQNGWGLINVNGEEIINTEYDTIYPLVYNFRIISDSSRYGLINKFGEIKIHCKYDNFRYLHAYMKNLENIDTTNIEKNNEIENGIFAFQLNGKWGFVSCNDEIQVQFKFDDIWFLEDSVFVGEINKKKGVYDYKNNTIINPEYDMIFLHIYGNGLSYAKNGRYYAIINSKNEVVSKCEYTNMPIPSGDYITITDYANKKFCMVNWETGEIAIPYGYERLGDYAEGLVYARKNGKYGYLNTNNEVVIPFKFENAEEFSEGLAMVAVNKGYWKASLSGEYSPRRCYGFIDKSGEFVIEPIFRADQSNGPGSGFKEGLAVMGAEREGNIYPNKFGYIDKTGKWVIKPIYDDAKDFINGVAIIKTNRGYGAINKSGEIVVEPKYYDYNYRNNSHPDDKIIFKDKTGKEYEYTLDGKLL